MCIWKCDFWLEGKFHVGLRPVFCLLSNFQTNLKSQQKKDLRKNSITITISSLNLCVIPLIVCTTVWLSGPPGGPCPSHGRQRQEGHDAQSHSPHCQLHRGREVQGQWLRLVHIPPSHHPWFIYHLPPSLVHTSPSHHPWFIYHIATVPGSYTT